MPARQTILDMSAYTIASASQLGTIKNAVFTLIGDDVDVHPITRPGASSQIVKRSGTLSTDLYSVVSDPVKVASVNVTAFAIGGTNLLADLRGGSFSGSFRHDEGSGVGDLWRYPIFTGKDYQAEVMLAVPATFDTTLSTAAKGAAGAAALVFTITINSVAVTLPMTLVNYSHEFSDGAVQIIKATLKGRSPDSGTYPTAPTGTTSLLEKALNAPETALAVVMTGKASGGAGYAGNFLYSGFGFDFNDASVISTRYDFVSQGAIT